MYIYTHMHIYIYIHDFDMENVVGMENRCGEVYDGYDEPQSGGYGED